MLFKYTKFLTFLSILIKIKCIFLIKNNYKNKNFVIMILGDGILKEMVKVKIVNGNNIKYIIVEKGTSIKLQDGTYRVAGKNPDDVILTKKEYKSEMKIKKLELKKEKK